jgi:hypothetical protein
MLQMRGYRTIKHDVVVACQHKISKCPPALNCDDCWQAYWENYADIPALHSILQMSGEQALIKQYGVKYVKRFKAYLGKKLSVLRTEESDAI